MAQSQAQPDTTPTPDTLSLATAEIHLAASNHDIPLLTSLLSTHTTTFPTHHAVDVQDPVSLFTPLHAAIAACETSDDPSDGMMDSEDVQREATETVRFLLSEGAIWNLLSAEGETPGCVALRLGAGDCYEEMVLAGVRAEVLLERLGRFEEEEDDVDDDEEDELVGEGTEGKEDADVDIEQAATTAKTTASGESHDPNHSVTPQQYLSSALSLSNDRLLDASQNGVMMSWETEIMYKSADAILYAPGLRVLNIGFGMGIIDTYIQGHANKPSEHHIVEAHPDVLAQMLKDGWEEKEGVVVHEGRWQDFLPELVEEGMIFDAIYFDTFAESYSEFKEFFSESVIGSLAEEGRWSFFNGMGADRRISYDVYQRVVEMDLFEAGFEVQWEDVQVDVGDKEGEWEGVKRRSFDVGGYRMPVVRFMGQYEKNLTECSQRE
jgi:protein arginine N-methyltransferase 2